ncbi:unnamed protein product [Tetraodon nigroviridis]|uniref:(spotted green pufferfish) hypothetical protein n=1 Tax=Tetraodon nigroviridis TaxID=99883 RepID=Q4T8I3_TETNG|nr:unnamed protein product [Tetraodon nigroviridis]
MKTQVTFALLVLACVLHHHADAQVVHDVLLQSLCCKSVRRMCVQETMVTKVVKNRCGAQKAILVVRKNNQTLCLDSEWKWAQNLLEKFSSTDAETKNVTLDYSMCLYKKRQGARI